MALHRHGFEYFDLSEHREVELHGLQDSEHRRIATQILTFRAINTGMAQHGTTWHNMALQRSGLQY